MTAQPRPQRKRKGDRLMTPGASRAQIECDFAIAAFDEAARQAERKWGIDRLPALATPETARKYGSILGKLNEAIEAENPAECARVAAGCVRGIAAMEAEAVAAGHQPPQAKFLEAELDGTVIRIVNDITDIQFAPDNESAITFTARECAVLLKALKMDHSLVALVKEYFPAAQMTGFQSKLSKSFFDKGGDEIPF